MISRLPAKRIRQKMGAREPEQKVWPRHRRFVRSHRCSVPGCVYGFMSPIEFAHWRSAANAGKGQTPHDCFGLSLCHFHHMEQHDIGQPAFERKYGISMSVIAAAFVKASPDTAMREAMRALETT